eukprot:PhF_6_TR34175/c0_g1_i1/m.50008
MSVLARLEQLVQSNPRAEELSLEGQGIDSLIPLMPLLSQMGRLKRLKLAGNHLTSLPEDMSSLRNLDYLDVSANPISGLNAVIRGLFCLSNLKHLYIDLPLETDEDEIIVSLTSLESFNGTPLTEGGNPPEASPAKYPPQASRVPASNPSASTSQPYQNTPLPNIPSVGGVSALRSRYGPGGDAGSLGGSSPLPTKTKWDDADMAQVQRLYQAANSVSGRIANKAEFDDYTRHIVTHLHTLLSGEDDPFKKESEILKAKRIMFEYCFDEISRSSYRFDSNLSNVLHTVQESYTHILEAYDKLLKNVHFDKDRKLEVMRTDMQHAIREIEQLMLQMEGRGGAQAQGGSQELHAFEKERQRLTEEIGWLRSENEKLQARLRQFDFTKSGSPQRGTTAGGAPPPQPTVGKSLTLRQLKEVVEDIYASKSKFDIKCSETHLPRETMEQHMYTYLNQKYGLKHLILDWATAIIQGVRKYAPEDNDVAVFGKILRNEVDEEFRFVQRQLKETVHELLRVYLKGKYPLKGDDDILQMLRKRVASLVYEEEWVDIVKYMYNAEDSVTIIMRIKEIIKQTQKPRRNLPGRRGGSPLADQREATAIPYTEFLKVLLDFQLEGHERFLAQFVRLFRQIDTDRNGILNEYEFRNLLRLMDNSKTDEEVSALLDLIDPHNNQLINFSECVTFLSSELVKMAQRQQGISADHHGTP